MKEKFTGFIHILKKHGYLQVQSTGSTGKG